MLRITFDIDSMGHTIPLMKNAGMKTPGYKKIGTSFRLFYFKVHLPDVNNAAPSGAGQITAMNRPNEMPTMP